MAEYSKKINNIINFKKTFNLIKKLENKKFCLDKTTSKNDDKWKSLQKY